jgi:hypothetical protein
VPDGEENAGTIASFDGTTLTINLFNGSSISGMVTQSTEIECEAAGDDNDNAGDDDNGDDDNSGPGGGGGDHRTASAMSTSDDGGGNDDNGDGGDDNGGECTTADLTRGTVVQQAELELSNGQATFDEVELVK